jgi:uncharacterized LabA/DUF88 family protein
LIPSPEHTQGFFLNKESHPLYNEQMPNNFAFIDSQNVNLGIQSLGWKLDWKTFRLFLRERYYVARAYLFLGYIPKYGQMYDNLRRSGFELVFKEVIERFDQKPKGNVDAELVLQAMIDFNEYEKAIIVTSDGDFACLVRHLAEKGKLERVLSPNRETCSALIKKAARGRMRYLEDVRGKIEYLKKS